MAAHAVDPLAPPTFDHSGGNNNFQPQKKQYQL